MHKYKLLGRKGEGTFSEVLKAQSVKTGKFMAIKCMKHVFESIEQVNSLREIQALRRLSPHPNIVKLHEVLYDQPTGRLALVFELMDCNIYELIKGRTHYLPEETVKIYMYQLMKAVDHMHRHGIFHRDIKPENLLIVDNVLKLADFGSCRGIYSKQPYTEYISTRWYRAPECLLTDGYYGYKMDLWGVGCVMFETLALYPLFPGTNEADQIERIHKITGTPGGEVLEKFKHYGSTHVDFNFNQYKRHPQGLAKLLPHVSADAVELMHKLLLYDPDERLTAREALRHPWFAELRAAEKRQREAAKARKVTEGGGAGKDGTGDDGDASSSKDGGKGDTMQLTGTMSDGGSTGGHSPDGKAPADKKNGLLIGESISGQPGGAKQQQHGGDGKGDASDPKPTVAATSSAALSSGGGPSPPKGTLSTGGHSGNTTAAKSGAAATTRQQHAALQISGQSKGAGSSGDGGLSYQIQGMKITGQGANAASTSAATQQQQHGKNAAALASHKVAAHQQPSKQHHHHRYDQGGHQAPMPGSLSDASILGPASTAAAVKQLYGASVLGSPTQQQQQPMAQQPSYVLQQQQQQQQMAMGRGGRGLMGAAPGLYGSSATGAAQPQQLYGSASMGGGAGSAAAAAAAAGAMMAGASPLLQRGGAGGGAAGNKYGPTATSVVAAAKSELAGINGGPSLYGSATMTGTNNVSGLFVDKSGALSSSLAGAGGGQRGIGLGAGGNHLMGSPHFSSLGGSSVPALSSSSTNANSNAARRLEPVQALQPSALLGSPAAGPGNSTSMLFQSPQMRAGAAQLIPLASLQQQQQQQQAAAMRGGQQPQGSPQQMAALQLHQQQQQQSSAATAGNSTKYAASSLGTKGVNSGRTGGAGAQAGAVAGGARSNSKGGRSSGGGNVNLSLEQPSLYGRKQGDDKSSLRPAVSMLQQGNVYGSSAGAAAASSAAAPNVAPAGRGFRLQAVPTSTGAAGTTAASGNGGPGAKQLAHPSGPSVAGHLKRASDIYITGASKANAGVSGGDGGGGGRLNGGGIMSTAAAAGGQLKAGQAPLLYGQSTAAAAQQVPIAMPMPTYLGSQQQQQQQQQHLYNPGNSVYGSGSGAGNAASGAAGAGADSGGGAPNLRWDNGAARRRGDNRDRGRPLMPLYSSPGAAPQVQSGAGPGTGVPSMGGLIKQQAQPGGSTNPAPPAPAAAPAPAGSYSSPYTQKVGDGKRF